MEFSFDEAPSLHIGKARPSLLGNLTREDLRCCQLNSQELARKEPWFPIPQFLKQQVIHRRPKARRVHGSFVRYGTVSPIERLGITYSSSYVTCMGKELHWRQLPWQQGDRITGPRSMTISILHGSKDFSQPPSIVIRINLCANLVAISDNPLLDGNASPQIEKEI